MKKDTLLEAIAGKNRGLLATDTDKLAILAAIAQLEDYNPTPRPVEASELLNGNWRLIYTTSQNLLNLDQFPLVKLGQIYQYIEFNEAAVYNIAEVYGLPFLEGLVSVVAKFEPVSEKRINVIFQRSISGLQRLIDYQSPEQFIANIKSGNNLLALDFPIQRPVEQKAWLDITYLDEDLRISRGNEGNVFVQVKVVNS